MNKHLYSISREVCHARKGQEKSLAALFGVKYLKRVFFPGLQHANYCTAPCVMKTALCSTPTMPRFTSSGHTRTGRWPVDIDSPFKDHEAAEPNKGSGSRTVYILFCNGCLQLRYAPSPMICGKCQTDYETLKVYETKAPRV